MDDGGTNFKDYDAAVAEVDEEPFRFKFGGKEFSANLNVDGGIILRWMENARSATAMAVLLKEVLGEDQYKTLLGTGQPWRKFEALLTDIFTQIGGPGNGQSSVSPIS